MLKRFLAGLLLTAPVVHAEDLLSARIHVAQELADCAAYYWLLGHLPGMQSETAPAADPEHEGMRALQAAADYSNPEQASVRFRLAMLSIKTGLESNWSNVLAMRERHVQQCPALVAEPELRVAHWLERDSSRP